MARVLGNKLDRKFAYIDGKPNDVEAVRLAFQRLVDSGVSYRKVAQNKGLVINTVRYYFKGLRDVDGATIDFMGKLLSYTDKSETETRKLKESLKKVLKENTSRGLARKTGATQQNIVLYMNGSLTIGQMTLGFAERLLYGDREKEE